MNQEKLNECLDVLLKFYPFDKDYIENGEKFGGAFGRIVDNKPHGVWLLFYPSLLLYRVLNYKHGILHGDSFSYHQKYQSIYAYEKFKNGEIVKEEYYYETYYIGHRGIKSGKYHKLCSGTWYNSKYPRYYPIPKELEDLMDKYYLIHEFYEEELYEEYKKTGKYISRPHKYESIDPIKKINNFLEEHNF
jgi:hypothetical protein